MIRANEVDERFPRFGIDPWSWRSICQLARDYQQSRGGYDFPNRQMPAPQPTRRMQFARYMRYTLEREEWNV